MEAPRLGALAPRSKVSDDTTNRVKYPRMQRPLPLQGGFQEYGPPKR